MGILERMREPRSLPGVAPPEGALRGVPDLSPEFEDELLASIRRNCSLFMIAVLRGDRDEGKRRTRTSRANAGSECMKSDDKLIAIAVPHPEILPVYMGCIDGYYGIYRAVYLNVMIILLNLF